MMPLADMDDGKSILQIISQNDLRHLVSFGDTDNGYVARGEVAKMYKVPAEDVDALVLGVIYGIEAD